tara:strand:+ start:1552 stop:2430 length:879 start_codon:yes stop_codon:yes gene_type:complete
VGFNWDTTDLLGSNVLKAEHINDGVDAMQNFVNEGISKAELKSSKDYTGSSYDPYTKEGWVESKHVFKPEFFGSPSPRMMAVSGQTHFRETNNSWTKGAIFQGDLVGNDYVGVPGVCTKIKLRHNAIVNIMTSFYVFEWGGVNQTRTQNPVSGGYERYSAGAVYLKIDDSVKGSTLRPIFTSSVFPYSSDGTGTGDIQVNGFLFSNMIGRHQHTICAQYRLNEGTHDIGIVCKPYHQNDEIALTTYFIPNLQTGSIQAYGLSDTLNLKMNKNIFFLARNLVVDIYYTDSDPE